MAWVDNSKNPEIMNATVSNSALSPFQHPVFESVSVICDQTILLRSCVMMNFSGIFGGEHKYGAAEPVP